MNALLLEASRWLWDYYLLASALLAIVLFVTKFTAQPARRMAIHWSAAAGLALLALLCALPGWSFIHMLSSPAEVKPAWTEYLEPTLNPAVQVAELPPSFQPELSSTNTTAIELNAEVHSDTQVVAAQQIIVVDYAVVSFCLFAAGSIVAVLWLALGAYQLRSLRSKIKSASAELLELLHQISADDAPTPELGVVAKLPVAVAIGLLRPMILLPQRFLALPSPSPSLQWRGIDDVAELRTVLAHELAHIRHYDLWLLALMRCLLLLLWPHPLFWLWRRNVRLDQETLADAAAAEVTNRTDYAEQLVDWARVAAETPTPRLASSVGLWESPSQLKRRIAILLDERLTVWRECSRTWRSCSVVALVMLAVGLSLVTLQPAAVAEATANSEGKARDIGRLADVADWQKKVKIIAIGTHDENPQQWWDHAGNPIKDVPFKWERKNPNDVGGGGAFSQPDSVIRKFVLKIEDLPQDARVTWWNQPGVRGTTGGVISVDGQVSPHGYKAQAIAVGKDLRKLSLRVGIAAGQWETKHELQSSGYHGRGDKSVTLYAPRESGQKNQVAVSHNYSDQDYRLFAVDKQGEEHIQSGWGGRSSNGIVTAHASFPNLKPEEVSHYLFKVRDYEWVELKDLPLAATGKQISDPAAANDPVWTPPENPDPVAIRKEAREDAKAGRFEIALAKRLWYHENVLDLRPSQSGVRLSFALSEWLELGEEYPPALAKMKQLRDVAEQRIRDPEKVLVKFEDFQAYAAFNRTLREPERTLDTFRWLDKTDPEDAEHVFRLARKALIQTEAYQLYGKYIDPQRDIKRIGEHYRQKLSFAESSRNAASVAAFAKNTFAKEAATLVAVLVKLERGPEAEQIVAAARQVVRDDDEQLNRLNHQLQTALKGSLP